MSNAVVVVRVDSKETSFRASKVGSASSTTSELIIGTPEHSILLSSAGYKVDAADSHTIRNSGGGVRR